MMPTLSRLAAKQDAIAVIGLGHVGLALSVLLAQRYAVIGYDIDDRRRSELQVHFDRNWQFSGVELERASLTLAPSMAACAQARVFIITVSTGIAADGSSDLEAVKQACQAVGVCIQPDALVIIESTVPVGATEQICVPIIAAASQLTPNQTLFYGYSPERINIGDREHAIPQVVKVVSGSNPAALELIDGLYREVIPAGTYRCGSVAAAEMCKLMENAQRDVNIAFANAIARLCHGYGIETSDVFAAAGTKWNALPFRPGLVGGGCIGMATAYLDIAARAMGMEEGFLASARQLNEGMERFVEVELQHLLGARPGKTTAPRIIVFGVAFKADVSDTTNSRAITLIRSMERSGWRVDAVDPYVDQQTMMVTHRLSMIPFAAMGKADAVIVIVGHRCFAGLTVADLQEILGSGGIVMDLAGLWRRADIERASLTYWRL